MSILLRFLFGYGKLNTFKVKNCDTIITCAVCLKLFQRPQNSAKNGLVAL